MFGLFAPRCPISPRERVQVERGLGRLIDILGLEWVRSTPVLTPDDLQDLLSVEPIAAADLAARLAPQFPFSVEGIVWSEPADIAGDVSADYVVGDPPTAVVPHQPSQSPEQRTAIVARCLCEHALAARAEFQPVEQRPAAAVDLLGVLAGMGIFAANAKFEQQSQAGARSDSPFHQRPKYMPARQFGYALAVRSMLSDGPADWSSWLRLDAREPFDLGRKFLHKQRPVCWDASRDTLRSYRNPLSAEDLLRRLRKRNPAVQIDALCEVCEFHLAEGSILHEVSHLVHDSSQEVREEAIRTIVLLDVESNELSDALIILCGDSVPRVRSLAAQALGEVTHRPAEAVETLRSLTRDPEPIVSAAAAESMLAWPEGLADDGPRLFRVLRQQLARCNYESVDRFVRRLGRCAPDAAALIEQEFAAAEDETWRTLLLESLAGETTGGPPS
jgi:hypothetical protein